MKSRDRFCYIQDHAFASCRKLERITNIPSNLKSLGNNAFIGCYALVVVDFSATCLKEVPSRAFQKCTSLQAVRLPMSVTCLRDRAFIFCVSLVTVEIPKGVFKMDVELETFYDCRSLTNIGFPSTHTFDERSFSRCTQLQTRLGPIQRAKDIFFRLDNRLLFHPVHEMCYYSSSSATTTEDLCRCIDNQDREELLAVDPFDMTPFHVLCSLVEPRQDLFQVLLGNYPSCMFHWKDANGKRFMDYLLVHSNRTDIVQLLKMVVQVWMLTPLARWSTLRRRNIVSQKAQVAVTAGKADIGGLLLEAFGTFQNYELLEHVSILEMALWKKDIKSGWQVAKRVALDREYCLNQCGSSVILPSVGSFLGMELIPSPNDRIWKRSS